MAYRIDHIKTNLISGKCTKKPRGSLLLIKKDQEDLKRVSKFNKLKINSSKTKRNLKRSVRGDNVDFAKFDYDYVNASCSTDESIKDELYEEYAQHSGFNDSNVHNSSSVYNYIENALIYYLFLSMHLSRANSSDQNFYFNHLIPESMQLSIEQFTLHIGNIGNMLNFNYICYPIAFVIIDRLIRNSLFRITEKNLFCLGIIAVVVANKLNEDNYYCFVDISNYFNINVSVFEALETEFLNMTNLDLFVDFSQINKQVEKFDEFRVYMLSLNNLPVTCGYKCHENFGLPVPVITAINLAQDTNVTKRLNKLQLLNLSSYMQKRTYLSCKYITEEEEQFWLQNFYETQQIQKLSVAFSVLFKNL